MTTPSHTELAARLRAHADELNDAPVEYGQHTGKALAKLLLASAAAMTELDRHNKALVERRQYDVAHINRYCAMVVDLEKRLAAALESPERVQGEAWQEVRLTADGALHVRDIPLSEVYAAATPPAAPAQYSLPDELYESKDWKAANYAGRVEWLHAMYEAKKKELESFLSMATPSHTELAARKALHLLKRYVSETPLCHQPHMIALEAAEAIEQLSAALESPRNPRHDPHPG